MKMLKKLGIFLVVFMLLCSILSISVFATDAPTESQSESATDAESDGNGKLDMNLGDPNTDDEKLKLNFEKRVEYALQGTVTGMLMVFAVLALLALIVSLSKVIFYTIPNRKAEEKMKARESANPNSVVSAEPVAPVVNNTPAPAAQASDDGELAAVITAAIAAMIESGDYKNEFVGGFRVVSFKRSTQSAWNRK